MNADSVKLLEQAFSVGALPSWVNPLAAPGDFAEAEPQGGVGFVWDVVDVQYHPPTGECHTWTRRRLITRESVQHLGQVGIEFDPETHLLNVNVLAVWRGSERRDLIERRRFFFRQHESDLGSQIVRSRGTAIAIVEDLRVGDCIELGYTLRRVAQLPGAQFEGVIPIGRSAPVRKWRLRIVGIASPVNWKCLPVDHPPLSAPLLVSGEQRWELQDLPATKAAPLAPAWWPAEGLVWVSEFASWQAVAQCVHSAWARLLEPGHEPVKRLAMELSAGIEDTEQQALAAVRWVQDEVRYLAIHGGLGAVVPRPAERTLEGRYGDCKDRAVLLIALLRCLNIIAEPVLVHSVLRSQVRQLPPCTLAFDHVIVAVRLAEGTVFVDPTQPLTGGSLWEQCLPEYGLGLVVSPETEALSEVVSPSAEHSLMAVRETFHLDATGLATRVEWIVEASGMAADALRREEPGKKSEFAQQCLERMKQFQASAKLLGDPQALDDRERNRLVVRGQFSVGRWAAWQESRVQVFRHLFSWAVENLPAPDALRFEAADHPLALPYPLRIRQELRVTVNSGTIPVVPKTTLLSNDWFRARMDVRRHGSREVEAALTLETFAKTAGEGDADPLIEELLKLWAVAGVQLHIQGKAPANVAGASPHGTALAAPVAEWEWPLRTGVERAEEWFRQPCPKWWQLAWSWGLLVAKGAAGPALVAVLAFGAAFYFESHDVEKQLRRATNRLWKQPQFLRAWNDIGWNNYDGATLCLNAVNETYRDLPLYLAARALIALGENDFDLAQSFAERALERDPKQLDALGVIMRIHYVSGRLREASQLASHMTGLSPDNSFAWHWKAQIDYEAHDLEAAERSAQKALQLDPSDTFSIRVVARVAANRAGCDAGMQVVDAALQQQPNHPHLLETKAELLRDAHRFEEALAAVDAALQGAPGSLTLRAARLLTRVNLGKVDGLASEAQLLLADRRIQSATQTMVARALSLGGELGMALPVFARFAQEHPDSFISQNDYGYSLLRAGDPQGAMPVLQRAVQLDPKQRVGWENLLNCAIALGRTDIQAQCAAELAKIGKSGV